MFHMVQISASLNICNNLFHKFNIMLTLLDRNVSTESIVRLIYGSGINIRNRFIRKTRFNNLSLKHINMCALTNIFAQSLVQTNETYPLKFIFHKLLVISQINFYGESDSFLLKHYPHISEFYDEEDIKKMNISLSKTRIDDWISEYNENVCEICRYIDRFQHERICDSCFKGITSHGRFMALCDTLHLSNGKMCIFKDIYFTKIDYKFGYYYLQNFKSCTFGEMESYYNRYCNHNHKITYKFSDNDRPIYSINDIHIGSRQINTIEVICIKIMKCQEKLDKIINF